MLWGFEIMLGLAVSELRFRVESVSYSVRVCSRVTSVTGAPVSTKRCNSTML